MIQNTFSGYARSPVCRGNQGSAPWSTPPHRIGLQPNGTRRHLPLQRAPHQHTQGSRTRHWWFPCLFLGRLLHQPGILVTVPRCSQNSIAHKNPAPRPQTVLSNTSSSSCKNPTRPTKSQSLSTKELAKFALRVTSGLSCVPFFLTFLRSTRL